MIQRRVISTGKSCLLIGQVGIMIDHLKRRVRDSVLGAIQVRRIGENWWRRCAGKGGRAVGVRQHVHLVGQACSGERTASKGTHLS